MRIKINVISATIVIALAIGITAYAHGPAGDSRSGYEMGERSYAMMGGHGMMGGYGHNGDGYDGDARYQNGENSRGYRQNDPNYKAKAESLINEIEEKRKELSSLLRSSSDNKALIDKKIEELNSLERYLDEMMP